MKLSICIPAFKRVQYLKKLLDSIAIQTFKDFEVVITDDSNDTSVAELVSRYSSLIPNLRYFKNDLIKGTPENWNEAIRNSNAEWIKIMHDDDWFSSEDSLKCFVDSIELYPEVTFFFSAYNNFSGDKKLETIHLSSLNKYFLKKSPFYLFRTQFIGNPSCTLVKKQPELSYEKRLKWVVDFEYYIRYLLLYPKFHYIDKTLVNVGLNEEQVTKYTFRNPKIEIPENHFFLSEFGPGILKNVFVYDYYWRMYRNLRIRNVEEILSIENVEIPNVIKRLVGFQRKLSPSLLRIGIFSKFFMLLSYLTNPKR